MRIFSFIMLLAFTLSGYSAAVHAMPKAPGAKTNTEMTSVLESCASFSDHGDSQNNSDGKEKTCHGCCLSYSDMRHPVAVPTAFFAFVRISPPLVETLTSEYRFSLLRPPRAFV